RSTVIQALNGTELGYGPFWSPDGRSVGFFADGHLKRIEVVGGVVQTLASAPIGSGGSWSQDGIIAFAPTAIGALFRVPAVGGEAAPLTRLNVPEQTGHRAPVFLPDGRHFLFFSRGVPDSRGIYLGNLDQSEPRRLMDSDTSAVFVPPGHFLFVRQGVLFAQAFDGTRLQVSGDPFAVVDGIAFDVGVNIPAVSASSTGSVALRTGGASGQRRLIWFDRSGRAMGAVGDPDITALLNPEISPDGRWVAVNRTVEALQDIWLIETDRGVPRRITFAPVSDQIPVWSPDGERIYFGANRKAAYDLYEKDVTGPAPDRPLFESDENKFPMSVSPDGRYLLFRNTAPNTNWDLWVLPLKASDPSARRPYAVVQGAFQEMMGEFSPDSRWLAFQSNESGRHEVFIQGFPDARARVQVSTHGGAQPRWRRDGREIFYVALDGRLMAVPLAIDDTHQLRPGTPSALFMTRMPGGAVPAPQKQQYAVAPDGQRFLVNTLPEEAFELPITLILNWQPWVATIR
ncbi:MAG: TolB family protein, partial [Acidobacteriota bacterium]